MDETKLQELIEDEDFAKNVLESKTPEELESVLSKKGLKVSSEELEQIIKSLDLIKNRNAQAKDSKISGPIPISEEESTRISGGSTCDPNFNPYVSHLYPVLEDSQPAETVPSPASPKSNKKSDKMSVRGAIAMTGITTLGIIASLGVGAVPFICDIKMDYEHWKDGRNRWGESDTSFKTYWKMCKIKDVTRGLHTPIH